MLCGIVGRVVFDRRGGQAWGVLCFGCRGSTYKGGERRAGCGRVDPFRSCAGGRWDRAKRTTRSCCLKSLRLVNGYFPVVMSWKSCPVFLTSVIWLAEEASDVYHGII